MRHGGWYPDSVLRLFRKDQGQFGGENPHDKVEVKSGRVAEIPVPLVHYTYRSFKQYVTKLQFYAEIAALERAGACHVPRVTPARVLTKTVCKFLETYLLKRGCRDGGHGLIAAMGSSYLTFLRETAIWEVQRNRGGNPECG